MMLSSIWITKSPDDLFYNMKFHPFGFNLIVSILLNKVYNSTTLRLTLYCWDLRSLPHLSFFQAESLHLTKGGQRSYWIRLNCVNVNNFLNDWQKTTRKNFLKKEFSQCRKFNIQDQSLLEMMKNSKIMSSSYTYTK